MKYHKYKRLEEINVARMERGTIKKECNEMNLKK